MSFYEHTWELRAAYTSSCTCTDRTKIFSFVEWSLFHILESVFGVRERKTSRAIIVYSVQCRWHRYFHRFLAGFLFFTLLLKYMQYSNVCCLTFLHLRLFPPRFCFIFHFASSPILFLVHFVHSVYRRKVITPPPNGIGIFYKCRSVFMCAQCTRFVWPEIRGEKK